MANKMTKREYFTIVRGIVAESAVENKNDILTFIDHEVELLERKSSKATETKTQKENVGIMDTIVEVLTDTETPVTVSDMMKDSRLSAHSNQKLSALLKKLVDENRVVKVTIKKKSYFSVPVAEADSEGADEVEAEE